jgi:hypothetical protein
VHVLAPLVPHHCSLAAASDQRQPRHRAFGHHRHQQRAPPQHSIIIPSHASAVRHLTAKAGSPPPLFATGADVQHGAGPHHIASPPLSTTTPWGIMLLPTHPRSQHSQHLQPQLTGPHGALAPTPPERRQHSTPAHASPLLATSAAAITSPHSSTASRSICGKSSATAAPTPPASAPRCHRHQHAHSISSCNSPCRALERASRSVRRAPATAGIRHSLGRRRYVRSLHQRRLSPLRTPH